MWIPSKAERRLIRDYMKIGQRDVVIGFGKNKPWPRKYWVICSARAREWISPGVAGGGRPGFWLDTPRRLEIYGPLWSFMLALDRDSRWTGGRDFKESKWIEFRRRRTARS